MKDGESKSGSRAVLSELESKRTVIELLRHISEEGEYLGKYLLPGVSKVPENC